MYMWLLYPIVTADISQLEAGLSYREIRHSVESKHPQGRECWTETGPRMRGCFAIAWRA
jgi:hypothetical protein